MNQMPYPRYSPEIAPSDFFLFDHLKHKLQGCSDDSTNELFSTITNLTKSFEKSLLHRVFDEWISCLHLFVESDAEYIKIEQSNFVTRPVA
jgi:hypothetical protein